MLAPFNNNKLILPYKNAPYQYFFESGYYLFQLWGASGGGSDPGCGAYVSGSLKLETRTKFFIFVGQKGINGKYSAFNGGGQGQALGSSGGGSTDIRLKGEKWDDFESLKSRIIVAGAGGGSQQDGYNSKGGNAGIFEGSSGSYASCSGQEVILAKGGKQTEVGIAGKGDQNGVDGDFGMGGNSSINGNSDGGGSGYFGGGGGATSSCVVGSGAGGSSFVSGLEGCKAIMKSSKKGNMTFSSLPYHYSGLVFTNISTKVGSLAQCNGDGKVEITFLLSIRDKFFSCKRQNTGIKNIIFFIIFTYVS